MPRRKKRDPDRTKTLPGRKRRRRGGAKDKTRLSPARYAKKLDDLFQDLADSGVPVERAMEEARETMQVLFFQKTHRKRKF